MNDPLFASPTWLSLTAPKRAESEPATPEPGFAQELAATNPRPSADRPEKNSGTKQQPAEPTDRIEKARSPQENEAPPNGEGATDDPSDAEAEFLVVSVAVETLVLETPPDAQLPAEASTTIDVSLGSSIEAVPETDGDADSTPIATPGVAPSAQAVGTTTVPLADLSAGDVSTNETASLPTEARADVTAYKLTEQPEAPVEIPDEIPDGTLDEIPDDTVSEFDSVQTAETISTTAAAAVADVSNTEAKTGDSPSAPTAKTPSADDTVAPVEPETSREPVKREDGKAITEQPDKEALPERPKPLEPLPAPIAESAVASVESTPDSTADRVLPTTAGTTAEARPTSAVTAAEPAAAEPAPAIDPTRFVSRVARAFDIAQERGGGPIEMRLSPPELGSMQVKIELKEGVMTASLDVETPAARTALLDNLPALRDRLEQQQIRIESFDVDVREDSGQRGGDWQPSGGSSDERSEDHREPAAPTTTTGSEEESEAPSVSTIHFGDDAINLVA